MFRQILKKQKLLKVKQTQRPIFNNIFGEEPEKKGDKKFQKIYQNSLENPEKFWKEAAEDINWIKEPTKILDDSKAPFYRWFPGGLLNTCYNALDVNSFFHY